MSGLPDSGAAVNGREGGGVGVGVGGGAGLAGEVGGEAVLLEPGIEHSRLFLGAHIYGAIEDTRPAIEIEGARNEAVVARIDAGRIGLQAEIAAGLIKE